MPDRNWHRLVLHASRHVVEPSQELGSQTAHNLRVFASQVGRLAEVVFEVVEPPVLLRGLLASANLTGQLPALVGNGPAIIRVGEIAVPRMVNVLVVPLPGAGLEQRQQAFAVDLAIGGQGHAGQIAEGGKQIHV